MNVTDLTLRACAEAIAAGEVRAVDATEAALRRIEVEDGGLGAMLHVDAQGALERARGIDADRAAGREIGVLGGVPLTIKDNIGVPGMPMTAASKILGDYRPPFAATVTERLLAAGAVILGKNNLDEFGMGSSTENSAFGPTRHPTDPERVPGGSSGGSAAAVVAGYGQGSLGTDTGGSIRLPAALCGAVGVKPTYGRVSRHGVVAFASSLDQVGPITRTVADAATLLRVIAGPCDRDSTCSSGPVPDMLAALDKPLAGLRIGLPRAFFEAADGLQAGVLASTEAAVQALRDAGATMVDVDLPHSRYAIATYYLVATAEASSNLARYDGVRFGRRAELEPGASVDDLYAHSRGEGFGPEVKRRIVLGTFALASGYYDAYYERACKVRRLIHDDYVNALADCDVLIGPVCPTTAWKLGEHTADPLQMYLMDVFTTGASLAGVPAMSVPIAPADGLPVGLQIIGRHFDESTMLRVGHRLTTLLGTTEATR